MDYEFLTEDQRDSLRSERLFALEADYFRYSLLAEEDPHNQDVHHQLLRIRDRILHHRHVLAELKTVCPEEQESDAATPETQE